jgi:UPF0755 protein
MLNLRRGLIGLVLLIAIAAVTFLDLAGRWQAPLTLPDDGLLFTVSQGETLGQLTGRLHRDGHLQHPLLVNLYGRFHGLDQQIRAGEYRIPSGTSPAAMLDILTSGDVVRYRVTLPEGITLAQALDLLQDNGKLRTVLAGPADPALLALASEAQSPEGLFLPETYTFEAGDSDLDILTQAHRALWELMDASWPARASGLPYETPYEAIIMASIVERETAVPEERDRIAGVFVRRLQRNMRLQTDPTVIYGLGTQFDGNLRRVHLDDADNPYNTYRHHGLPPTPIALPGAAAITAALHPADGDALYFVARGDGSHAFSSTLAEHTARVREFQLQRRSDYRSTPSRSEP